MLCVGLVGGRWRQWLALGRLDLPHLAVGESGNHASRLAAIIININSEFITFNFDPL